MRLFLLLIGCCLTIAAHSQHEHIGEKNIRFIDYPDFPEGNSTWGDIGYNPMTDAVYIGVTNHKNKIGFYEYAVSEDLMILKGFVNELAHLRDFQWQGKIHSKITFDENGNVYFATDGGESREEYLMNHPHGYYGGYFMKWDPEVEEMTNLGMTMPYESIKNIDIDTETGKIYAITYPQVHFIIYDPNTNTMEDLGRLGSAHVPRMTFTDKWNNCYYVDWRQRLVKYEKSTGKLVFARESLPAFEGTPGQVIITGVKSYTKDNSRNIIYLATYGAKVLAFHPTKEGIGEVEDLGALYETKDMPLWNPYASNLNLGLNGNLYYVLGGHGNYVKKDTTVMMELNPETKEKREVMTFPIAELSEVTGTGVRDSAGNLYFAGRKIRPKNTETPESLPSIDDKVSIPFMIQFNPEKELND
ncbi:MAG: hypothetical protein RLO17_20180 [Cyclobacteriaceae bacterium]